MGARGAEAPLLAGVRNPDTFGNDNDHGQFQAAYIHLFAGAKCRGSEYVLNMSQAPLPGAPLPGRF
jgi:hypothetical protein